MRITTPSTIILFRFFSALPFAIFYSSLQLYLLDIGFQKNAAISLVGSVLALSFGLSLVGGYLAKRRISYRAFFVFSIICSAAGCFAFASHRENITLWLICLFLLGSVGINVSLNMMLTQYCNVVESIREKCFIWLYLFLNLGYLAGYTLAGYYGSIGQYYKLSIIVLITTVFVLGILLITWKSLDKTERHIDKSASPLKNFAITSLIMFAIYLLIRWLLSISQFTNIVLIGGWLFISLSMLIKLIRHYSSRKKEVIVFYILLFASLTFWSAYFLAPMALIVFIHHHVNLDIMGITVAPQWVQNINTIVIVVGTFILGSQSKKLHLPIFSLIKQFSLGLVSLGIGFLFLVVGIMATAPGNKVAFFWVVCSYVLQSVGELLIGPISYSLIGRLIPVEHQNIMMGVWVTLLGVASAIASKLSIFAPYSDTHLLSVLHQYKNFFSYIGFGVITISIFIYTISKRAFKPRSQLQSVSGTR